MAERIRVLNAVLALEDICPYNNGLTLEWNLIKARANQRTHGVSFVEAATVLEDDLALTRPDPDAVGEQRYVTLGLSDVGNLIVVVFTYRGEETIRLISAWKANRRQRILYEKGGRC